LAVLHTTTWKYPVLVVSLWHIHDAVLYILATRGQCLLNGLNSVVVGLSICSRNG